MKKRTFTTLNLLTVLALLAMGTTTQARTPASVRDLSDEPARSEIGEASATTEDSANTVTLPAGVSTDWWSDVQENIRQSEYHVTWQDQIHLPDLSAAYQAPNRAHNLRTYFTETGIRVIPRTSQKTSSWQGEGEEESWEWGLALTGYGYAGNIQPVGEPAQTVAKESRFEYHYPSEIIEWYLNDERGLEQGFTIQSPPLPRSSTPLFFDLALSGNLTPNLTDDSQTIEFTTPGGVRVLRYADLHAYDATGRELPAHLELLSPSEGEGPGVRVVVDDTTAAYPITIDPLIDAPTWTAESNQSSAQFGLSVGTAGDVNNDSYDDVIIGARYYDNGQTDEGRAFVYHGSASGLSTTPDWTTESNQANAQFGYSVSTAGNVNDDDYDDVIVGATQALVSKGGAYVYHGSASGLSASYNWKYEASAYNTFLGNSVGTAGDVNHDGYDDVIVGASSYDSVHNEGAAYVFHGSASGLSGSPNWFLHPTDQDGAGFGYRVSTAGDVNKDTYDDVIVAAAYYDGGHTDEGRVYVYHGSVSGLSTSAAWTAESNQGSAYFGGSVATVGDVNHDTYDDIIIGAHGYDNGEVNEGAAFIYYGSASGLGASGTPANADWTAESNLANTYFGASAGLAGDLDGDGYDDVIIGTYGYDGDQTDEGAVFIYPGSAAGLGTSPNQVIDPTDQYQAYFGISVGAAGDVNGDGYDDVIVGAHRYDGGQTDEGRAYVFYGSTGGLGWPAGWSGGSNQAGAQFGVSATTAGDVNGDGFTDIVVGANLYDNGETDEGRAYVYHGSATGPSVTPDWTAESDQMNAEFGWSVGTAGDVNGDGYADVIVGARYYDNSQNEEGGAFVWYGSSSGLGANGNPANADWTAESDQVSAEFGCSVSTAGDVNGDGYADVIVGAHLYNNDETDEGRAYVYHGSSTGLATGSADWTAESDQDNAEFGYSVSTAGDVNGDGYADVIVGAHLYDNDETDEGRAYVYYGSSTGLTTGSADWTAESDQDNAEFGYSVGAAGDVNGDGYADVIVGAHLYDGGETDEGQTYVYYGSSTGLTTGSADWTAESDQDSAECGASVGTAGDVNGDGYADVIVGAHLYDNGETDEGAVWVFHGSATGLGASGTPTNADWTFESDQDGARLGNSAATAGDVNGDGYADVIVGAYLYDDPTTDEGRAYVFYGAPASLGAAAGWTAESDYGGASFGLSVGTAGDVNGDGYADVIVGATGYDNGETDEGQVYVYHGSAAGLSTTVNWTAEGNQGSAYLGTQVGTAGDVNGDGYADVIVGAAGYDNDETDEGAAFVYHGSATGLDANGARPSGNPANADWMFESDQANVDMARLDSASTAGDVNGDGYADVIVGARNYDNGQTDEGRAWLFHGSASGLSTTANWMMESNVASANFGYGVGTAGDVDGDGYSDVVVGAASYNGGQSAEGRAYLYLGSATGLSTSAAWTYEPNRINTFFGDPAGTAGDVNGDGYADVLIGSTPYDGQAQNEGRAWVFYGSATGLSASPNWVADPTNQATSWFGYSGAAGDVNGDGYADVIVGANAFDNGQTDEGRVYFYLGSASGLDANADWTFESDQAYAYLGTQVGTAGDVNGDGYADVIVGAYQYDNGETNEGRAWVFYGNDGAGLSLNPRQRRSDDSGPINHLGMADANAFRLAALGRTPFGRGKVKLEWQVAPLGTPFTATTVISSGVSVAWADTITSGVELNELVSNLSAGTLYHWRIRLRYHPATTPFQQYSRWLTMPWNGWQEADLRASSGLLPTADLVVAKTDTPSDTLLSGDSLTYTLAFSNSGVITATNVYITDTLPITWLTNITYTASGVAITRTAGTTCTWQVADLSPGVSGTITITARVGGIPASIFVLTNTVEIATSAAEGTTANNSATVTTTALARTSNLGPSAKAGTQYGYIQQGVDDAEPGDTLLAGAGVYTESLTLSQPISLTGISSGTTIVKAPSGARALTVTGGAIGSNVVISGLTFTDGDVGGSVGGGILITGTAKPTLQNVIVTGNQAQSGGGLYAAAGSPVTLINVDVMSNTAAGQGGGIYAGDTVTLIGGRVEGNDSSGGWGGGVCACENNTLIVTDTRFISNTATGDGGGVYGDGPLSVKGGRFEGNASSGGRGGGMYADDTLALTNVVLISNTASLQGGGAYASGRATLSGGRFEGNDSTNNEGGGMYAFDVLTVTDTIFINNTAPGDGGGVYGGGAVRLTGGSFEGNNSGGGGGGACACGPQVLFVVNTQFIGNAATGSGGGIRANGPATLNGAHLEDNVGDQGGGLYAGQAATLTGGRFERNGSNTGHGGGLYGADALTLTNTVFVTNTAAQRGGGMYGGTTVILNNIQFISNTATGDGGGMYGGGLVELTGGLFERNVSTGGGGGGACSGGGMTLVNVLFIRNQALSGGGAWGSGAITLSGGGFEENASTGSTGVEHGGGLYAGGALTLTNTEFDGNTAVRDGGGMYVVGAATLGGGLFEDNVGDDGGGMVAGSTLILTGTRFISNTALVNGGGMTCNTGKCGLANALFARNWAGGNGASLYFNVPGIGGEVRHATVVGRNTGSGIYVVGGAVGISNTIVASHTTGIENAGGVVFEDYNLYYGNALDQSGVIASGGHSLVGLDPAFSDPANDDYHLKVSSSAIDACPDVGVPYDLDGNPRPGPWTAFFDIGAYERQGVQVDLVMTKVVTPSKVTQGQEAITYTLTFSHQGNGKANGVVITDEVPISVTNVSYVSNRAITPTGSVSYTWQVGDLAPGEGGVITITGVLSDSLPGGHVFTNTATITTTAGDSNVHNNSDKASVTVADAELEISKEASRYGPDAGDTIVYTITVANNGPDDAAGVVVSDTLPGGVTYDLDDGGVDYDETTGVWDVGDLGNGDSATLHITVTVNGGLPEGTLITNTAVISTSSQGDSDSSNDEDSAIIAVRGADLRMIKTVGNDRPNEEDLITYAITVTNWGQAATVVVSDVLPNGVTYDSDDGGGDYDEVTGIWDVGNLESGDSATLHIVTRVDEGTAGDTIVNTAAISTTSRIDANPDDDEDDAVIRVINAELELLKKVSDSAPCAGSAVVYTLQVINNGPDDATGVVISDTMPGGVTCISSGGDGSYDEATGVWNVGSLSVGISATLCITVAIDTGVESATITNTTVISACDQGDSFAHNNRSYAVINVASPSVGGYTESVNVPALLWLWVILLVAVVIIVIGAVTCKFKRCII